MITMIVHVRVPKANAARYEAVMDEYCAAVHANEPGVVHYGVSRRADDEETYVVVEVYRDAEAQAAHMQTDWINRALPQVMALIEGRPDIKQYVSRGQTAVTLGS